MKLFYKSYAPDISAGSTTIKDVGKKRSPRKLITLWSFLMALLMMVPVGAMAAGDGTIDNPWTGDIEDKSFNIPNGSVYLKDVTGGQLHIQADGVTIYVAGNNVLTADNSNSGHPALELGSSGSTDARKLTIKYWDPEGNQSLATLTLEAKGESGIITATTAFPGVDLHDYQTDFVIDGPVMVKAAPANRGSIAADYAEAFFTSANSKIILSNGAYFTYSNNYKSSTVPSVDNWMITNFASVGDAAATLLASKQSILVNGGTLNTDLKTVANSNVTFYQAKIGEQTFYAPQSGTSFKLLVGDGLKDYYGELPTTTENVAYPFPIRTDNTADGIQANVNVGAVSAGGTYYGQLSGANGTINLNVTQYPHGGELSASGGDITLQGSDKYKVLKTVSDGLTLKAEGENILTLKDLTINADNKVYIKGNVHLDEINRCRIAPNVINFKMVKDGTDVPVYFCRISTVDTELMGLEADKIDIEGNTDNYPSRVDATASCIYMWLPAGSSDIKFKKKTDGTTTYSIRGSVAAQHNQTISLASPIIYIGDKTYDTLSEAFEAVQNGETIELRGNYTARDGGNAIATKIEEGQSFILSLGDNTLNIGGQVAEDGRYPLISTENGTLIITAGQGSIIGNYRVAGRKIATDEDLKGRVYTTMANPGNPHVGGTPVTPKVVGTRVTVSTEVLSPSKEDPMTEMPSAIHYTIDDRTVYAAKETGTTTKADETKYCLWLPNDNNTYLVQGERNKVFAQINNSTNKDNVALKPLFNLNSGSIKVTKDAILYADGYKYAGSTEDGNPNLGKDTSTPVVVTTYVSKAPSYNESYTLTVEDETYVMVKDIYRNELWESIDGKGKDDKKIATELVASGTANLIMSGINSFGNIEIAENSSLTIDRLDETPAQANALRFFTITGAGKDKSTLTMNGGALLSYITENSSVAMNTISNVKAVYKDGSVRAKFDANGTRFVDENDNNKALYRLTFSTLDGYTPYTVEYKDMDPNAEEGATVRVPLTSDKNGEVHLWLPTNYDGTSVSFFSANSSKTIAHPKIEENDENKAPIAVRVFRGEGSNAGSEIGTFRSLARAFAAIETVEAEPNPAQQYTIELLMPHTESNADCVVPGKKVTLKLNGYNLICNKVTFDTDKNANAFLMITNDVDINKHSSIEGEISIRPNVYISRTVHMTNVHVTNKDHKTVYRTLVTGLEHGKTYRYFYNGLQRDFKVENQVTDGDKTLDVACLWPYASQIPQELLVYLLNGNEIDKNGALTVPGGELAITSHFDNYLALVKVENVAKVGNTYYRKFSDAIKAANDGEGDIQLLTNIQSQAMFEIKKSYVIDLGNFNLNFTQGGFNVTNGALTISGGKGSTLTGVITLNGDVAVNESVLIGGVVLRQSTDAIETVYRLLVDNNGTQCVWTETPERDTDKTIEIDSKEYTIPAGLANHQTKVKAYPVVTITGEDTWSDMNEDCNIVLENGAVWTVTDVKKNIHRLTIHEGAKVVTGDGTKITATDGIRYIRTFKENAWSMIALPYTATDVTTVIDDKVVSLSPASNPGTSGHFWLQSIQTDGSTTDVTDSEMTANKVYVMKVPTSLATKDITFVSGPNQMLRRDKVLNPNPVSGFVAYANGTLNDVTLDKPFYQLNDTGDTFERVDDLTTPIAPFSGYLLADAATTAKVANFSLRSSVATDNEEIIVPEESLLVRAEKGRILLTAEQPMQVVICDMAGVVKFSGEIPAGNSSFEVGAGIHVVNNQKVIVW